jgi:hypothetical protein
MQQHIYTGAYGQRKVEARVQGQQLLEKPFENAIIALAAYLKSRPVG